ncbi:MAG: hypothetical protein QG574_4753 [Cyanobacteriota bacterium erpe_2018_sw_21hr_WHONDRS-SW48-000092_B_bin.40]|jgi:hypothetical protein|nr:hypothetical protein [Cyanobacteriota bacterium erpe_2018_sw_21hr_WHONDRS-SW48-000092_B_bin.40]
MVKDAMKKNKNQSRDLKQHEILKGHTREGSTFKCFPGGNVEPVSYINHGIPELIWLAILNEKLKPQTVSKIVVIIGQEIRTAEDSPAPPPFFATSLAKLETKKTVNILSELKNQHLLSPLRSAMSEFISLYPTFPIKWLIDDKNHSENQYFLQDFKKLLAELQDKTSTKSVFMISMCVYGLLVSGAAKISPTMLADFDDIRFYPDTENSMKLAATVRATLLAFLGPQISTEGFTDWSYEFWQRGLALEPINYQILLKGRSE